nr:hypothetical protein [Tanacetum cinerariifolium]
MVRDNVQLETAVNTITHEYLLEFTSEYGISEALRPELPGPRDRIVDFPEGKNIVPTLSLFRVFYVPSFNSGWMSFSKRPGKNIPQCYTKPLDSLKNWNNRFFWVDECVFPTAVEWRTNASKDGMPASGTYSVEATGSRPRAPHELPLLTLTASRVIEIDEPAAAPVVVESPVQESRKRGRDGIDANAPPKSLRMDHADPQPSGVPADVSDPDP